ncbi:MAG: hypothetical protein CM15mL5_1960 [uncultured marine virus]|nr:MAG: hypothetical protein CM15mL5_1960 [uncultured marine virus]
MRNEKLHIEHPEDTILTGDLSVLDAFTADNHYSVKIDGSPAIVWGTDPENGKFFVGTKSVFNKRTPKVNYSIQDIERNHPDFELQSILIRCFNCLPRIGFEGRVFQGDFIGFGGYRDYKPNAISYTFDTVQNVGVVVAPHTEYKGTTLKDMNAEPLIEKLDPTMFIQPNAWISDYKGNAMNIEMMVGFARQMATLVDFATPKEAELLKKDLNAYIRDGEEVIAEEFANYQLVRLWCLVENIKTEYMKLMRDDFKCDCFLGNEYVDGEGYVMSGEHGTYKLVNRWVFSHYNFNIIRS